MKCKLQGFNALKGELPKSAFADIDDIPVVLVKGPAFNRIDKLLKLKEKADAFTWPAYRKDAQRGGSTEMTSPATLEQKWTVQIGGKLTQPIMGLDTVFVAAEDQYTISAIHAQNGQRIWSFIAGGRIDSSPTLYRGLLVFGSTDGWVYCLDATDGALAWKFRAAPEDRPYCCINRESQAAF